MSQSPAPISSPAPTHTPTPTFSDNTDLSPYIRSQQSSIEESILDDDLIRITAAAWVEVPGYANHHRLYKDLIMSLVSLIDHLATDRAVYSAREQIVSEIFDDAYKEKMFRERRHHTADVETPEEVGTPSPAPTVTDKKGKKKAVYDTRDPTPVPTQVPLDIAKGQEIRNKPARSEGKVEADKPIEDPEIECADSDIQAIDPDAENLDKSLFKNKKGSSAKNAKPMRIVPKSYSKKRKMSTPSAPDSPHEPPRKRTKVAPVDISSTSKTTPVEPTSVKHVTSLDALNALLSIAHATAAHTQKTAENTALMVELLSKGRR